MSLYSPIRTSDPDLTKVQDRIRDTAAATTSRLNALQSQVDSNAAVAVTTIGTSTVASPDHDVTLVNTSAGMVVSLPDATKVTRVLRYKNLSGVNGLTLTAIAADGRQQTINGGTTIGVAANATMTLVSDGNDYHTL